MINWAQLLLDAEQRWIEEAVDGGPKYDRAVKFRDWIANRINRRLAGYEAVKRELEYVEEKTKALGRSTEFHAVLQISHIGREAEDAYK
jgi:GrpB-like predicted nucleotidyltransferase (UPF0157 family)